MATNISYLPEVGLEEAKELIREYPTCSNARLHALCDKYEYANMHSFQNAVREKYGIRRWKPLIETETEYITTDYKLPPDSTWEEHISVIKSINKLVEFHQKVPDEISVSVDTAMPIGIVHTSDWQLGQFGVDYDSFHEDMDTIEKEPGLFVGIGGDSYQNIIQPSKMGSSHNQIPISVQKGLVYLTYKKLIGKILYIGTGNHNYWTALLEGEDWDAEMARRLNLVYTKHCARIYVKVGNFDYTILRIHKSRFNSAFNLTHTCKQNQRLYFPKARIVVCEDKHVAAIEQYQYDGMESIAIRTGTYAVYDDFAQQGGYFGNHVANPTIVLFPNEDKMVGFKDMYDAIIFLRAARGN